MCFWKYLLVIFILCNFFFAFKKNLFIFRYSILLVVLLKFYLWIPKELKVESGRISSFTTTTGLCFEEWKKIRKAKIKKKKNWKISYESNRCIWIEKICYRRGLRSVKWNKFCNALKLHTVTLYVKCIWEVLLL